MHASACRRGILQCIKNTYPALNIASVVVRKQFSSSYNLVFGVYRTLILFLAPAPRYQYMYLAGPMVYTGIPVWAWGAQKIFHRTVQSSTPLVLMSSVNTQESTRTIPHVNTQPFSSRDEEGKYCENLLQIFDMIQTFLGQTTCLSNLHFFNFLQN